MRADDCGVRERSESIQRGVKRGYLDQDGFVISFHKFEQDEEKAVRRYETLRIGQELAIGIFWQLLECSYASWISNSVRVRWSKERSAMARECLRNS